MKSQFRLIVVLALLGHACSDKETDPVLEALKSVPNLSVTEETVDSDTYRKFHLILQQPLDHDHPDGPQFGQHMTLYHTGFDRSVVFMPLGYDLNDGGSELTLFFAANELSVEHRYYGQSAPEGRDWRYLNIRQAAEDHHTVVETMKQIYSGPWLSTGHSKGGDTALFHARFYPRDVDATVAYVAPLLNDAVDARFPEFFEKVGTADCRARLVTFQKRVMARRFSLGERAAKASAKNWEKDPDDPDRTFVAAKSADEQKTLWAARIEISALHFPFRFWQYLGVDDCAAIPAADANDARLFFALTAWVRGGLSDDPLVASVPYQIQDATQLGVPHLPDQQLAEDLEFVNGDPRSQDPFYDDPYHINDLKFDPAPMQDITRWAQGTASRITLIYGENDPWSAAMIPLKSDVRDNKVFVVPGANHNASFIEANSNAALGLIHHLLDQMDLVVTSQYDSAILRVHDQFSTRHKERLVERRAKDRERMEAASADTASQ